MGPFFLADAISKQDIGAFQAAATINDGIDFHEQMNAVKTSATWVDARLTEASQQPITDHLASHFDGKQVTANEKEVDKIGRENQKTTRVFDTRTFTTRVGKRSRAQDVTAQPSKRREERHASIQKNKSIMLLCRQNSDRDSTRCSSLVMLLS
jgi:hypothetical protein